MALGTANFVQMYMLSRGQGNAPKFERLTRGGAGAGATFAGTGAGIRYSYRRDLHRKCRIQFLVESFLRSPELKVCGNKNKITYVLHLTGCQKRVIDTIGIVLVEPNLCITWLVRLFSEIDPA